MISLVQRATCDGDAPRTPVRSRAAALQTFSRKGQRPIRIALVNNMSGAAFAAAERQYLNLLAAAADGLDLQIGLFTLQDCTSNADGRAARYFRLSDLWGSDPDALIVTGAEPRTSDLVEESYWPDLKSLVEWAQTNVVSAIWSCLAGHAAVRCLDGVLRHPLPRKCFGIYSCEAKASHPLLNGMRVPIRVPHSRWNELDSRELRDAGYEILTQSATAGVDVFIKHQKALFVIFQGHPEYEHDTLLREYRRDVGRYLRHESNVYPRLPDNCLELAAVSALLAFQHRAGAHRCAALLAEMPLPASTCPIDDPCGASARRIYENWLRLVAQLKTRKVRASSISVDTGLIRLSP